MSVVQNESEDGTLSRDQSDSPLIDEGNCGGSMSGGVVLKKGPWTSAEDAILVEYVKKHGEGNWNAVQKHSGLFRCGKSCRLRWANHLRPNLKKGSFTAEEERLIIELHAKMGNKWARMAAHLPGRTDNEIKNYWNTRIKRRQRAGLPLYPPEVCLQAYQENQQNQNASGIHSGDDLSQTSYEIPDVIFDSLKANQGVLPYVSEIPDYSSSGMLMKGLGSSQFYSFVPPTTVHHRQKRLRESVAPLSGYSSGFRNELSSFDQTQDGRCESRISQSFDFFPYDPDPINKNLLPFGVNQGSHSLLNGNFSASKPTPGAVKLELPSLQYPETDLGSWGSSPPPPLLESVDAFIQSPPSSGQLQSDCHSPRNSGLLDALLYEAKTMANTKNQSSDKSSSSSIVTPGDIADSSALYACSEWDDCGDPKSPLGNSTASIFSECTPISATGSSLDEAPAETFPGSIIKSEPVDPAWTLDGEKKENSCEVDFSRPDALLGSCWLEQSVACAKNRGAMTDAIAALLGDDLGSDFKNMAAGTSTSSQGWGYGSCTWNNMPAVRQMSELP
ncbi:hypothetical protein RJ640_004255 [Escallonia rubra]|uniref:Transcription factor GAMYB n=1 Tax=Escallonia rubra TaxID=112253 RepID=A0AA88UVU5_9ASTE|nr:hypothetical protein RJ640_004255 [Escallonia rubra]